MLLEVGLGGRLDATNLITKPSIAVITPISLDHTELLADNVEEIAREKAGILKPGVTAVIGPQRKTCKRFSMRSVRGSAHGS